jgi:hypothetical protein
MTMPIDPDWDHVPPVLRELDGQAVTVLGDDGPPALLTVLPGAFGEAARRRNGFYEGGTDAA